MGGVKRATLDAVGIEHWAYFVSAYLIGYCGRSLDSLPNGIEWWLAWAWSSGKTAQWTAAFLSVVKWPNRATLDADPSMPRASTAELKRQAELWRKRREPRQMALL